MVLSILLVFDKCACQSRWLYQSIPHDARKLIDHRTLHGLISLMDKKETSHYGIQAALRTEMSDADLIEMIKND